MGVEMAGIEAEVIGLPSIRKVVRQDPASAGQDPRRLSFLFVPKFLTRRPRFVDCEGGYATLYTWDNCIKNQPVF